jgi:hypothetical protein
MLEPEASAALREQLFTELKSISSAEGRKLGASGY